MTALFWLLTVTEHGRFGAAEWGRHMQQRLLLCVLQPKPFKAEVSPWLVPRQKHSRASRCATCPQGSLPVQAHN